MSVLKRKRRLSDLQFYVNAIKIREDVLSLVENETYVPKRKRFLIGIDTFYHSKRIVDFIVMANAIFPHTTTMLFARKWYQQKAICECEVLIEHLRIIMSAPKVPSKRIINLTSTIIDEINLLRNWRNSSKILTNRGKYKKLDEQTSTQPNNNANETLAETNITKQPKSQEFNNIATSDLFTENILQTMLLLEESWPIDRPQ